MGFLSNLVDGNKKTSGGKTRPKLLFEKGNNELFIAPPKRVESRGKEPFIYPPRQTAREQFFQHKPPETRIEHQQAIAQERGYDPNRTPQAIYQRNLRPTAERVYSAGVGFAKGVYQRIRPSSAIKEAGVEAIEFEPSERTTELRKEVKARKFTTKTQDIKFD